MIKINSKKEKTLAIDLEIQNTAHRPDVRFVIETQAGLNLSIPALMEGTSAVVRIPALEKIMPFIDEHQLSAKLEAVLEDQYFTIWKGDIEIETPISISATNIEESETESSKQSITAISMTESDEDDEDTELLEMEAATIVLNKNKPKMSMKDIFRAL